jgi:hypothetical protein
MKKLADISDLKFNTEPKVEEEVILVVFGYLRDAAWSLESEKIYYSPESFEVDIKLFAKRDSNLMAAQVIKGFQKEIPLIFDKKGKWTVKCNTKIMEVEIKE